MAQEAAVDGRTVAVDEVYMEDGALVVCKSCGHLVPRTMMCLYCGAPILFRKPRQAKE